MPGTTPRGYEYPLYGDTQDFPAQIQTLAEDIDVDVQGLYDAAAAARNAPSATVQYAGLTSVPSGVNTPVTWTDELYDNDNMVDLVAEPTAVSINEAGLYLVSAWIEFAGTALAGAAALFVQSAGGVVPDAVTVTKGLGAPSTQVAAVALTRCGVGENITVSVRQSSGSPLDFLFSRLNVTKVAP